MYDGYAAVKEDPVRFTHQPGIMKPASASQKFALLTVLHALCVSTTASDSLGSKPATGKTQVTLKPMNPCVKSVSVIHF